MRRVLVVLISIFLLNGCASFTSLINSPTAKLKLLPVENFSASVLLKQDITLIRQEDEFRFLSVIRVEHDRLALVAVSPIGMPLFSLEYVDGEVFQTSPPGFNVPGEEILAVLQFSLWPQESIKKLYSEAKGWSWTFSEQKRTLIKATEAVLQVDYNTAGLTAHDYLNEYTVMVKTLEKRDL